MGRDDLDRKAECNRKSWGKFTTQRRTNDSSFNCDLEICAWVFLLQRCMAEVRVQLKLGIDEAAGPTRIQPPIGNEVNAALSSRERRGLSRWLCSCSSQQDVHLYVYFNEVACHGTMCIISSCMCECWDTLICSFLELPYFGPHPTSPPHISNL